MLLEQIILGIIGLSCGLIIAGGIFAFITMIGLIPRFAAKTNTAKHIMLYEDCVVLGGTLGNILYLYRWSLPLGYIGVIAFGIFSGMFVGCLAVALAEVLDTIPIFAKRIKLTTGAPYILLSLAIGKGIGTLVQFFYK